MTRTITVLVHILFFLWVWVLFPLQQGRNSKSPFLLEHGPTPAGLTVSCPPACLSGTESRRCLCCDRAALKVWRPAALCSLLCIEGWTKPCDESFILPVKGYKKSGPPLDKVTFSWRVEDVGEAWTNFVPRLLFHLQSVKFWPHTFR